MIKQFSLFSSYLFFVLVSGISFSQSSCPTDISASGTDESGFNLCDGTITIVLTGGSPDFIYSIADVSNPLNSFVDTSSSSSYTFTGLCPGTYEIIISDITGLPCSINGTPGGILVTINPGSSTLSVTCEVLGINCWYEQGDVSATALGNAPPFSYSLNGGPWTASGYFAGAAYGCGSVSVAVQDASGQIANSLCYPICDYSPVPTIEVTSPSCISSCSGEAYLFMHSSEFSSANPPYSIYVEHTSTMQPGLVGTINNVSDTIFLTNLCTGEYNAYSLESMGNCPSFSQSFTITELNTVVDTSVTLNSSVLTANAVLNTSYQWIYCDSVEIEGATFQSFTPTENGNYAVVITQDGCVDTSGCYMINTIGINELYQGQKKLVKIVDSMGRETEFKPNILLFLLYSDGTIEKVLKLE